MGLSNVRYLQADHRLTVGNGDHGNRKVCLLRPRGSLLCQVKKDMTCFKKSQHERFFNGIEA